MSTQETLPVPVLQHPHWRVNWRPAEYDPARIPSLTECINIVRKTQVRLRGWDFPPVPPHQQGLHFGSNWAGAASDAFEHYEYWRLYQSAQFLYLGSVREVTEKPWFEQIQETMKWRLPHIDIETVPGFISITECIYVSTEIFEFAARLSQAKLYPDPLAIVISLKGIRGFLLAADPNRSWRSAYAAAEDELHYNVTLPPADLVANASEQALMCSIWLFERFGWLNPSVDVLRSDQQKLLAGRL